MTELLDYGGPVLWLQVVLGFLAVVFVVERLLYFHGVRINAPDFLRGLANHIRRKAFAEGIHEASRAPGPVAEKSSPWSGRNSTATASRPARGPS